MPFRVSVCVCCFDEHGLQSIVLHKHISFSFRPYYSFATSMVGDLDRLLCFREYDLSSFKFVLWSSSTLVPILQVAALPANAFLRSTLPVRSLYEPSSYGGGEVMLEDLCIIVAVEIPLTVRGMK